jgi:uncharacterized protein (TIGR02147 family)
METPKEPNIYKYLDYRKYLLDFYNFHKKNTRGFSYRSFAKKANLNTENYLKRVIDKEIHLTKTYRNKFAIACNLNKNEKEFFFLLIDYAKTKKISIKEHYLKKLNTLSLNETQKEIKYDQYDLLNKWYNIVIRSLVTMEGFNPTAENIAKKLKGFVTKSEVQEALKLLTEKNFIQLKDGKYALTDRHIKTRDEVLTPLIQHFHSQMIPIGVKALKLKPLEEREVQALTLGVSKNKAKEIKKEIKEFFNKIVLSVSDSDEEKPEEVWQFNLQFFNFTNREAK